MEGNLKGVGAGCPFVPKDELMGKKTSLVDQGTFAGTLGKKEFMTFERRGRQLRKSTSML